MTFFTLLHIKTLLKRGLLCIATDKRGYPHNIFLISPRKHMMWVLIRSVTAYVFIEKYERYQHFLDEKSALSVAMGHRVRKELASSGCKVFRYTVDPFLDGQKQF